MPMVRRPAATSVNSYSLLVNAASSGGGYGAAAMAWAVMNV
jgi:hypothetical protein